VSSGGSRKSPTGCQLITYADSLGGNLRELKRILEHRLREAVRGVHILPFYPSSADRGFAPLTYDEVDPAFGTWDDVEAIGREYQLVVDLMLNHISRQSPQFRDFVRRRDESPHADMFIRWSDVWPAGEPTADELARIYTRKPRAPYTEVDFADGTRERLWCTFDEEQIDIDVNSPGGRAFITDSLRSLCRRGVSMIRLDAFAYATKKAGTSCFFVEPNVWEILDFARTVVEPYGVHLLPEIHEHHRMQLALASRGYWVYDFALPMLVLQAIYDANGANLVQWLRRCPSRQITTLDTHDGIGVVDVVDLMSREEIETTKANLYGRGANIKPIYSSAAYDNLDVYQINCTYYSALGNRDDAYLTARAIQLFAPGVPQIYYVGLLAGENDIELVETTKVGRDINRHGYGVGEVERELERPVVRALLRLMELRNTHAAFTGALDVRLLESGRKLECIRTSGPHKARLSADLSTCRFTVEYTHPENRTIVSLDRSDLG
jgi:sucrose phosphorylase